MRSKRGIIGGGPLNSVRSGSLPNHHQIWLRFPAGDAWQGRLVSHGALRHQPRGEADVHAIEFDVPNLPRRKPSNFSLSIRTAADLAFGLQDFSASSWE